MLVTHDVEALYLCDRVVVLSARPRRPVAGELTPALAAQAEDRTGAVTGASFAASAKALSRLCEPEGLMRRIVLPAALILALFGVWELLARTGALADLLGINQTAGDLIVPAPTQVIEALWEDRDLLADNGLATLKVLLAGVGLSLLWGRGSRSRCTCPRRFAGRSIRCSSSRRRSRSSRSRRSSTSGSTSASARRAVIVLICFFPVTVNALDGLGRSTSTPSG